MLNLRSLFLSVPAAEHFGAEGLRALDTLHNLQYLDLARNASDKPMSGQTAVEMLRTLRGWHELHALAISGAKLRFYVRLQHCLTLLQHQRCWRLRS